MKLTQVRESSWLDGMVTQHMSLEGSACVESLARI